MDYWEKYNHNGFALYNPDTVDLATATANEAFEESEVCVVELDAVAAAMYQ
jgi:hypothetical protein